MTSLLPLLPDSPRLPLSEALAGGPAAVPAPGAGASGFAGLVEAFAAPPPAVPAAATPETGLATLAEAIDAEGARGAEPDAALPNPATALAAWPTGKNLPEPGALLPPAAPPAVADEAAPAPVRPAPLAEEGALLPDTLVAPPSVTAAVPVRGPLFAMAGQHAPRAAGQVAGHAKNALRLPEPEGDAPALPDAAALAGNPARAEDVATGPADDAEGIAALTAAPLVAAAPGALPDPALLPLPVAAAPTPAPDGNAQTATRRAAAASPTASPATGMQPAAVSNRAPRAAAAMPSAPVSFAEPAPVPASEPSLAPGAGGSAEAVPDPEAPASASAAPSPATPAAAANIAPSLPERGAQPRGAAPVHAAPQLESAIAQVGDIREALRSARPAMTLQHAEFGAVSIRLEPAAPDQWRAVLASRDPGFVPAIHAALAERAVTAAADTSGQFSGHSGTHQNGTADQRYGSSPNGGQGSPQPYLGQSGARDGEAAQDHRRPSTAAALAARGGSEAEDPAASTPGSDGLFA